MICIICEKEFTKSSNNQKCCSKKCSKIRYQYKEYHKKYIKEYQQTSNGKEVYKKANKKYRLTIKGKQYYQEYDLKYYQENKNKILENHNKYLKTSKGKKVQRKADKKCHNKRYRDLGFNPLNEYFQGSHAHHINKIDVIYIPKEYHFIAHSILRNKNMEPINTIAFFFLLMQNINEIRTFI